MIAPRDTFVVREQTVRSMIGNRDGYTRPELALRKLLWQHRIRGYRLRQRVVGVSPDLLFRRARLAVFLHGCFWHRCPNCKKEQRLKTNARFWLSKMISNEARDLRNLAKLVEHGYATVVIWECEFKRNPESAVTKIKSVLESRLHSPG